MAWQDDPIIDGAPLYHPIGAAILPNFGQRILQQDSATKSFAIS